MARLTLLQLNDLHGYLEAHPELVPTAGGWRFERLGGVARIARLFADARADGPCLTLDNGDTFHGTRVAVASRGEALVPIMNALKIDAMTAHWEFAYGPEGFTALARQLDYPVLAANVFRKATGDLLFEGRRVFERGGLRIGVIGLACPIVDKTMPPAFSEGVRFELGVAEAREQLAVLRGEGVDLVVLLSHLGFPQDLKLASELPGLDVILSGHTHNRLHEPARVGATLIIQSGCHGAYVGRLDLDVADGQVSLKRHQLIPVDDGATDPGVEALVRAALAPEREAMARVIGRTAIPLHRYAMASAPMDDVLLAAVAGAAGTEIAFSNGWRYGAPVAPGPVTLGDLYNIVPMNPSISRVTLTGAELMAMLEENLERTFAADPFEQMGGYIKRCRGLTVFAKLENPKGARVDRLLVGDRPVDPQADYPVAFVTSQGVPERFGGDRRTLDVDSVSALQQMVRRSCAGRDRPAAQRSHCLKVDIPSPRRSPMKALLLALAFAAAVTVSPAFAQVVPGYGGFTPLPEAGEQPDPDRVYKVVFDVSQGGPDDSPNRGLDRVARLINMLAAGGVDADHRQVVVVVHGAATLSVLSDPAWVARGKGAANPNSALIRALIAAGVEVRICGQAMVGNRVAEEDLAPGVTVDLAALMTVVHHQQAGYGLIAD